MADEEPEAGFEERVRRLLRVWRHWPREISLAAFGIGMVVASKFLPDAEHLPESLAPYASSAPWLFALGGILLTSYQIWKFRRRAAAPPVETGGLKPAAIKGPAAFGPADSELFARLGRQRELAELRGWILDDQVPLVALMGESGVGKTSLLRAGLAYALEAEPVYFEALPSNPSGGLLAAVHNRWASTDKEPASLGDLPNALRKIPLIVVIDQLEQLDASNHPEMFELLREVATQEPPYRSTWIVAFRREYSAEWKEFELSLPKAASKRIETISLRRFSVDQAEKVFAVLAEAGDIPLDQEAMREILVGVSMDGMVSPVEIGISLLALSELTIGSGNRSFTATHLRDRGGREGLLASYLERLLEDVSEGERKEILRGLLLLTDLDADRPEQRVAEGLTVREIVERLNPASPRSFERWLAFLASPKARVLEELDDGRIRLLHDQWVPAVHRLSGSILAQVSEAQRVLHRAYRAWSEDQRPRDLLQGHALRKILRNLPELHLRSQEMEYLRRSRVRARWKRSLVACALLGISVGVSIGIRQFQQRDFGRQFASWGLPSDLPEYLGQLDELTLGGPVNDLKWLSKYDLKSIDLRGIYNIPPINARIPSTVKTLGIDNGFQTVNLPETLDRLEFVASFPYGVPAGIFPPNLRTLSLYTARFPTRGEPNEAPLGKFQYGSIKMPLGLEVLRIFDPSGVELVEELPKTLKTILLTGPSGPGESNLKWKDLRPLLGRELLRLDLPLIENLGITVEAGNASDLLALSAFPRLRHLDLYVLPGNIQRVRFPSDLPLPKNIASVHLFIRATDWATGRIELPSGPTVIQALSLVGGERIRLDNRAFPVPASLRYLDLGFVDARKATPLRLPAGLEELILGAQPVQSVDLPDGLRRLTLLQYGAKAGWSFPDRLEVLRIDFPVDLDLGQLPKALKTLELGVSQEGPYLDLRGLPRQLVNLRIPPTAMLSLRGLPKSVRSLGLVTRAGPINDWLPLSGSTTEP